ncbi:putative racemase [Serratia marcescens]|uniref:Putative racemase n=1 Tax=Serratia marcescens TaxID=615 RepID=A0A379YXM7_SERMA|nr:putative racemase [Serratia marcescens]
MKVLGLLGGMSWESTIPYYRTINEQVKARLGGLHSAKIVLYSVDFQEIERLQHQGDWDGAGRLLAEAAVALRAAGAEAIVICTNTMHKVAEAVEQASGLPLIHIADATALQVREKNIRRVGLLGTRFTMDQTFYRGRLQELHGIDVVTPVSADRDIVHRIIYDELCLGKIRDASRDEYRRIISDLEQQGGAGDYFRLHRNRLAGERAGCVGAGVRHHRDPRPRRRGVRAGLIVVRRLPAVYQHQRFARQRQPGGQHHDAQDRQQVQIRHYRHRHKQAQPAVAGHHQHQPHDGAGDGDRRRHRRNVLMQHQAQRRADEHRREDAPAAKTAGGGDHQRRQLGQGNGQQRRHPNSCRPPPGVSSHPAP